MRFSIHGFDQKTAVEFGLTNDELLILRHFEDFVHSGKMDSFYEEGYMYYWVNYNKFLEDLPILKISKDRLGDIMLHVLGEKPIELEEKMKCYSEKMLKKVKNRKYIGLLKNKTIRNPVAGVRSYFAFTLKFYKLKQKITNNDDSINTDSVSIPERFGINTDIDSVSIPEPNRYQYRNKDYSINDYSINDIDRYSPLNKQEVQHTMPNVRNEVLNPTACGAVHVRNEVPSNKTNINKTNLTNNIYSSVEQKEEKTKDKEIYKRIVDYLNKTADKSFKSTTKKTISLIDARLKEGFTEEEFYKVIDNKVLNWLDDDKMNAYLRPETLFGNKFESYLNETPKKSLKGNESVKGKTKTNNNKFANFDQTFNKYSEKELDAIIKKSQSVKFK
ncbi:conserved phage C-terminal domain-containing protein [Clostridioides difficile]|uniref:conserved phage C-terminal domain-containing protein n=1 Tax=Clostridioides difficile TaxID=1496 RepID=UPI001F48D98D|nr:conserved phage C-terminal domain-containing protein [Clostridioides difficile]